MYRYIWKTNFSKFLYLSRYVDLVLQDNPKLVRYDRRDDYLKDILLKT